MKLMRDSCGTHAWNVGNNLKGDATAGDVAAVRHPLQEALGETLTHRKQVEVKRQKSGREPFPLPIMPRGH